MNKKSISLINLFPMKTLHYLIILLSFQSCLPKSNDPYTSPNFNVHVLTEGVYAWIHKIGGKAISNTTIVDNGDFTIVFDCFLSPEVAEEIPILVQHYGLSPLKFVVLSHYHNDHIRGSQVLARRLNSLVQRKLLN